MERHAVQLNTVLEIVQEFGPARAVPERTRIKARLPYLPRTAVDRLLAECEEIQTRAYELACQVWANQLTVVQMGEQLRGIFPELTEERLSHTVSQAMYFASK